MSRLYTPFPFRRADQLSFRDQNWLVQGLIEEAGLMMLFGEPASGKSFLALAIAASVSTGVAWNGNKVRQGTVFYIAGEGFSGLKKRLLAWEIYHGLKLENAPLFFSERPAALSNADEVAEIARTVKGLAATSGQPALVIIDTLARNIGDGDENSTQAISNLIGNLDRELRVQFNCAVMFVHHCGHDAGNRARGSSSLRGAMDSEFRLSVEADGRRKLVCTKMKDHETPRPLMLDTKAITLPYCDKETGEHFSSLVLIRSESQETSSKPKRKKLSDTQQIVLNAFKDALEKTSDVLPTGLPSYVTKVVHEDEWKKEAYSKRISSSDQSPAMLAAFNRARQALQAQNYIEARDGYYWLIPENHRHTATQQNIS